VVYVCGYETSKSTKYYLVSVKSTSSDTTVTSARSLLEILKAPQASDLTRSRKVDCNRNPLVGKKRSRGQGSSEPKLLNFSQGQSE